MITYSGLIYYGNNDYRDYVAHSKGPWKNHLYKFIDAAGNYVYDTAKKISNNITGKSHAEAAAAYRKTAVKSAYKANKARSTDYIKKYGTAASNREYNYRNDWAEKAKANAEAEEKAYRNSLHYRTVRMMRKIKTSASYKKVEGYVDKAAGALKTPINTVKNALGSVYNKGKELVGRVLSGIKDRLPKKKEKPKPKLVERITKDGTKNEVLMRLSMRRGEQALKKGKLSQAKRYKNLSIMARRAANGQSPFAKG